MQKPGTSHLAIPGPLAIEDKLVLRVAVVPVSRPTVTDFFTLKFNLAYARLASAAKIVRNLHELEDVLL